MAEKAYKENNTRSLQCKAQHRVFPKTVWLLRVLFILQQVHSQRLGDPATMVDRDCCLLDLPSHRNRLRKRCKI